MVRYGSFDLAALPQRSGSFRLKPFRPGLPRPKSNLFYWGSLGQSAFSGNKFDFGTIVEVKRTVREYHNQNYCQRMLTPKDCEGVSKLKGMPGSITIKQTARKYSKKKYCQVV